MEAEVAPALPALLDPVVAASPPWESDEEMANHELGDAGITLPEPCDAAGPAEEPLMEADVAPDLPDLLDLVVAASPPRESDEEMANLQGAGVVLAPLSLPSALFQIPGVDFVMPPSAFDVLLDECPGDWLAVQAVPQYRDTGAQLMLAAAAAGGPPRMDEPVVDETLDFYAVDGSAADGSDTEGDRGINDELQAATHVSPLSPGSFDLEYLPPPNPAQALRMMHRRRSRMDSPGRWYPEAATNLNLGAVAGGEVVQQGALLSMV